MDKSIYFRVFIVAAVLQSSVSLAQNGPVFSAQCVGEAHGINKPQREFKSSKGAQNWCSVYHKGNGHSCSFWEG